MLASMKVLTTPQPQAFTTPYLRNRKRVQADTPDYSAFCWGDKRRPSDVDRLVYRDSRNVLCTIPYASVIEFSGIGTLVLIAEHDGRDVPRYQVEAYLSLDGYRYGQRAELLREGDVESLRTVTSALDGLLSGSACFIEEKRATEPLSTGEARMMAGLRSTQRQECWVVLVTADGTPYAVRSADGRYTLTVANFRTYVEAFGGF
jgi:hypothetical protein